MSPDLSCLSKISGNKGIIIGGIENGYVSLLYLIFFRANPERGLQSAAGLTLSAHLAPRARERGHPG